MVVPLLWGLEGDARLLQQVVLSHGPTDLHPAVKAYLDEFTESRAVVVSDCLCISCKEDGKCIKRMKYIHTYVRRDMLAEVTRLFGITPEEI